MEKIIVEPFDATYIVELHGVTMIDNVVTFTPTMGADSIGDLLDRLVKIGAIEGYSITFQRKSTYKYDRTEDKK